jgi:ATPase family associated with various cellular activities (AAA)/AAA+ lid domain
MSPWQRCSRLLFVLWFRSLVAVFGATTQRSRSSNRYSYHHCSMTTALLFLPVVAFGWTRTSASFHRPRLRFSEQPRELLSTTGRPFPNPKNRIAALDDPSVHQEDATGSTVTDSVSATNGSTLAETTHDNDNDNEGAQQKQQQQQIAKNAAYMQSLLHNLQSILDKWMISGNKVQQQSAYNLLEQIQQYEATNIISNDSDLTSSINSSSSYYRRAQRLIQRAGLPIPPATTSETETSIQVNNNNNNNSPKQQPTSSSSSSSPPPPVTFGWSNSNPDQRRTEATTRNEWEQQQHQQSRSETGNQKKQNADESVLQREKQFIADRTLLQNEMMLNTNNSQNQHNNTLKGNNMMSAQQQQQQQPPPPPPDDIAAMNRVSALMASASINNGMKFDGSSFGIGGLDDILQQIQRRIYIPIVAPPKLLQQLGITPVRGMLLYGPPGCGKTLIARQIGQYLSPLRPITVVSGPEIMDKFVGSSEMKLRSIFDNPPHVYESIRQQEPDQGVALSRVALHVIILDEFDAIARQRGGREGGGDQGDAGVARDSVVNQLLAKMDGVVPLVVPTLVIGVTNKRSLIDTALLRPGRFEVQIEVPPPQTIEQRVSILNIHTRNMQLEGRLLVQDAPMDTAAANMVNNLNDRDRLLLPTYADILLTIANVTDGFTGASLAAVVRAAASFALERSVTAYINNYEANSSLLQDCVVTMDDFETSIKDFEKMDGSDGTMLSAKTTSTEDDSINETPTIDGS